MKSIILCIIASVVLLGTSIVTATTVNFIPPTEPIWEGDMFSVTIQCSPSEPMKAWETKILFNPQQLQVTEVTEGDIFNGYQTFFNAGETDNQNGEITKLYDLIVGQGNVTSVGSFVVIKFIAIGVGTSQIELANTGVTNETQYLDIETINTSFIVHSFFDIDGNGVINLLDLVTISNHYGETGDGGWIPQDVDKDGRIKVIDLVLVSNHIM